MHCTPKLHENAVSASIGAAALPTNGAESLIEAADQALYQSKGGGRGIVSLSSRLNIRRATFASAV